MHKHSTVTYFNSERKTVDCRTIKYQLLAICSAVLYQNLKHRKLEGRIVWNDTIQYSPEAVHYLCTRCLFTSFIRICLVSHARDWVMSALSAASLIFSFQFSPLFFRISVARPHQHCGVLLVLIRSIGHQMLLKIWVATFLYGVNSPGEDFELILTVNIETRCLVEDHFCSDFSAICNYCGVRVAWKCKIWKFWAIFGIIWKNDSLWYKCKILFRKFSLPHQLTLLCSNVVKFIPQKIVHYLPDPKKFLALSQIGATAKIAPKTCQRQPPTVCSQCSRFHPNRFTFGTVVAERVNTVIFAP